MGRIFAMKGRSPQPVSMSMDETALFLAICARDGARFPGLAFDPIPKGTPATTVGAKIGIARGDVLEYCQRWAAYSWYDYRNPDEGYEDADVDAGWATEIGKIAAAYLWGGDKAGEN